MSLFQEPVKVKNLAKSKDSDLSYKAIFYTDGSAKPRNPGYTGWSVHGYVYSDKATTKGAGHPKVAPSVNGYVDKGSKPEPIDVVSYYDHVGWSGEMSDNNAAELKGALAAMNYAISLPNLSAVTIYSDSKYTIEGTMNYLPTWVGNNWIKRSGDPVPYQGIWKEVLKAVDQLNTNKTKLKMQWVKGHADNFGNIQADQLASIAGFRSIQDKTPGVKEIVSPSQGYWKNDNERLPLLGLQGLLFSTDKATVREGEYFLTNQVKSHEFIGRNDVHSCYGYVLTKTPDPLVEQVRNRQLEQSRDYNTLILARIDRVYDKAVCAALERFGPIVFKRNSERTLDMHFINEDAMVKPVAKDGQADKLLPITEELYPPRLALRCVEAISRLKGTVEAFIKSDGPPEVEGSQVFDVTDVYYNQEANKDGVLVGAFKKELTVSVQSLIIRKKAFGRDIDFQQIFGIHILGRNAMKRLEGNEVKVWLVASKVSDFAIRYYTVIKSGDDWSAWTGGHSNVKIFKEALE